MQMPVWVGGLSNTTSRAPSTLSAYSALYDLFVLPFRLPGGDMELYYWPVHLNIYEVPSRDYCWTLRPDRDEF